MFQDKNSFFDQHKRYAIRKLAVGAGSVLIGSLLLGSNTVLADETAGPEPVIGLNSESQPGLAEEQTELVADQTTMPAQPSKALPQTSSAENHLHASPAVMASETTAPVSENLIQHKQDVTSSGVDLDDLTRFSHDYAFDGNPETRYAAPKMKENGSSTTDPQTPQWLQLDLGQKAMLTGGGVDFYRLVYSPDYEILTAAQPDAADTDWRQVVHRTALVDNGRADQSDNFTLTTPQELDRHVRIRFNRVNAGAGGYAVSVKDIRLQGYLLTASSQPTLPAQPSSELTNLALNRPATASGVEVGTNTAPGQAFDDNADSRWAGLPMKQTTRPDEQQIPQWLQVDLGADGQVKQIELDFFRKVYATDYTVLTSATGQEGSWKQLHRSTNLQADATAADLTDRISFDQAVSVNRYLRFQFNRINHHAGGNSVSVKAVRVLGHLTKEVAVPVDPVAKIRAASLAVVGDRVVLANAPEDDQYTYEVIGSANEYVVDNQGQLSSYRLNDLDVVMVVAARRKDNQELVIPSKVNKTVHVPASHRERVQGTNTKPILALEIQEFLPGQGVLTIGREATVHFADGSDKQAALFNKDLQGVLGYQLQAAAADQATISFKLTDDYDLKDEGYLMRVGDKVEVFAKDAKAFNYAAVTIAQMLQAQGHLTKGVYRDYPNYAIRGMLLDVARIPMRQDFLEEVSHLFRWYKLNELHLHINDNQWPDGDRGSVAPWSKTEAAHRLESTVFPGLNKMDFKHDRYEGEYDFYRQVYGNPAYSLDDFKAFQANNTAAGINTLVEIDTPGHSAVYSLYALKNPDNVDYLGRPIHHPRDLEALAINPETYPEETARAKRFVRELLKGYLDTGVFTYDQIHLGVDEYWQKNGNLEAFRTYLNELNDLAKEHGKALRTWGALSMFPGNTPVSKDIIFDEWAQYESVTVDRINEGFKVVNVPQPFTYVTPGRNHKDIINEQYVFDHWQPYIFNLDVAADKRQALDGEPLLLGAKGAMWGDEHYEGIEESDLYYRLEKSLAMIGFKTWNDKSERNFVDYQKAFEATRLRNNYLPYETKTEVVVNLDAAYASDNQVTDLSTNGLTIRSEGQTEVVELDGDKWLKFDGSNHLVTELETLSLPYTLEMTFRPTNVDKGSLLLSEDGALFLNGKGRNQAGDVLEGFGLNRYFYSQYLAPKLEVGKDYKLTLTGTREVLNVYLNDQRVASLTHVEGSTVGTRGNFRASFNLPLKTIGQGFEGYIKNLKVYNRTQEAAEIGKENLERVNIALHKPVYDYRHQSAFWNQHIKPYHRGRLTDGDVDGSEGRWNSSNHDRDYFIVDLEQGQTFNAVQVIFDQARPATAFKVLISDDLATFREVAAVADNSRADVTLDLGNQSARYVKFESVARKQGTNEVAVKEFRVYQTRTGDKSLLAQRFAQKEIAPDQEAWLAVNNVLANKFATAQEISAALNLLDQLADPRSEVTLDPTDGGEGSDETTPDPTGGGDDSGQTDPTPEPADLADISLREEVVPFDFGVERVPDANLALGEEILLRPGRQGRLVKVYADRQIDGQIRSELVEIRGFDLPISQIIRVGTKPIVTTSTQYREVVERLDFTIERVPVAHLDAGQEVVVREGVAGRRTKVYEEQVTAGAVGDRRLVELKDRVEPINQLILVGARPVVTSRTETREVVENLAFDIERVEDSSLPIGQERIICHGVAGRLVKIYENQLTNGVKTAERLLEIKDFVHPIKQLVLVGTGPVVTTRTVIREEVEFLPETIERVETPTLPAGEERLLRPGRPGRLVKVYEDTFTNGVKTAERLLNIHTVEVPIKRLVLVGLRAAPRPIVPSPRLLPVGSNENQWSIKEMRRPATDDLAGLPLAISANGLLSTLGLIDLTRKN